MTTHERLLRLCSTELDFLLQPAGLKATCSTCAKGVAPWTEIGADPPPRWAFESGGDVDYFVTPWPRDDDPDDWATSSGNVDYTRFYLPLWQNVDAILREMSDRRVLTKILRHIVERDQMGVRGGHPMVRNEQVLLMRRLRMDGKSQATAAAMSGMSERTARRWSSGGVPSEVSRERH